VRESASGGTGARSRAARPTTPADDTGPERRGEIVVGVAATAVRFGTGLARSVLLPGRLLARSFVARPVLRGAADGLASAGRDAEARGRRLGEAAAARALATPEIGRTAALTLSGPVAEALSDETIEVLARRVLASPAFETILREAARSQVARELTDEALHSPELERALEEVLAGPVRNVLTRQSASLWGDVTARVRQAATRVDDALEKAAHRVVRRPLPSTAHVEPRRHGGLASRGIGLVADVAITNFAVLLVGSLLGLAGSLLGLSPPTWLVAVLGGGAWTLFVAGYFLLFWTTAGQTPGMRLVRLRVVRPDGGPLTGGRSLLRLAGTALAIAPLGAGFLPVLFDRRRRALQDFLADTVVVEDDEPGPAVGFAALSERPPP
jgi:uncharacterized RDD family membrane protein YckC